MLCASTSRNEPPPPGLAQLEGVQGAINRTRYEGSLSRAHTDRSMFRGLIREPCGSGAVRVA